MRFLLGWLPDRCYLSFRDGKTFVLFIASHGRFAKMQRQRAACLQSYEKPRRVFVDLIPRRELRIRTRKQLLNTASCGENSAEDMGGTRWKLFDC